MLLGWVTPHGPRTMIFGHQAPPLQSVLPVGSTVGGAVAPPQGTGRQWQLPHRGRRWQPVTSVRCSLSPSISERVCVVGSNADSDPLRVYWCGSLTSLRSTRWPEKRPFCFRGRKHRGRQCRIRRFWSVSAHLAAGRGVDRDEVVDVHGDAAVGGRRRLQAGKAVVRVAAEDQPPEAACAVGESSVIVLALHRRLC